MTPRKRSTQQTALSPFEGKPVLSVGLEIRNAAGGLNEALQIDPAEWHHGERVTVVLDCDVSKLRFDPVKDTDGLRRVHVLTADEATVVDRAVVADALEEQQKRIEEAQGIRRLELQNEIVQAHDRGEHKRLRDDCPRCEEERAAAEAGD